MISFPILLEYLSSFFVVVGKENTPDASVNLMPWKHRVCYKLLVPASAHFLSGNYPLLCASALGLQSNIKIKHDISGSYSDDKMNPYLKGLDGVQTLACDFVKMGVLFKMLRAH